MAEVDYQWRNRRKLFLLPPHRYLKQELARISMPMDGPYFDERDEEEELVISEVLLGCPPDSAGPHISHFTISIPPDYSIHSFSLTIQHNIKSSIPGAGLQVWKEELVLSDFVLHKMFTSSEFVGITALELGAGTGLVGMLLAHDAKAVFLTDCGDEILNNWECCPQFEVLSYGGAIHVRELNWTNSLPPMLCLENSTENKRYSWTPTEVEEALGASLLLAADVIYSDDLTDFLFSILERLMSLGTQKVLYLELEKRYNFSLDDLDVVANGYSHFLSYLREEKEDEDVKLGCSPCFLGKRLVLSLIPQYMREYDTGNYVELW